jgi:hypothetical protein
MAVYTPLLLYVNLRHLPRAARPGWLCIVAISLTGMVFVSFAIVCLFF